MPVSNSNRDGTTKEARGATPWGQAALTERSADDNLQLTVSADKASCSFGEGIMITASLRNTGLTAVALDFNRG
ncbi:MAG: hypothetical protein QNL91_03645 [Candidatus Krumholzibacteria bacterium]|nr:hypothetical protein [Candidatus Krumholzibacteria bacterium]